jgi:hypothetical protein
MKEGTQSSRDGMNRCGGFSNRCGGFSNRCGGFSGCGASANRVSSAGREGIAASIVRQAWQAAQRVLA